VPRHPCVVQPQVDRDVLDAIAHYRTRAPGLAEHFETLVGAAIDRICEHPKRYRVLHEKRGIRREYLTPRKANRWPWAVYYRLDDDGTVLVLRVLHLRVHPRRWRKA
jgi:plasmid stabilization system protein ParE